MIPGDLKFYKQWICWKYIEIDGKKRKTPICPMTGKPAKTNDPSTWTSYARAVEKADDYDGIGFVFTEDDPFIGIDIDHCREKDGTLTDYAKSMIDRCGSYAEISPSGSGIHIIGMGKMDIEGSGKRTDTVEMYQKLRFFTITGNDVGGFKRIKNVQEVVDNVMKELSKKKESQVKVDDAKLTFDALPASEDDLTFLEKLFGYKNGHILKSLYEGENVLYGGDASRNDLYFCTYINWANGNDLEMTDRIFRSSARMRPKWDRKHYSNGRTYGQNTLAKAISNNPRRNR